MASFALVRKTHYLSHYPCRFIEGQIVVQKNISAALLLLSVQALCMLVGAGLKGAGSSHFDPP